MAASHLLARSPITPRVLPGERTASRASRWEAATDTKNPTLWNTTPGLTLAGSYLILLLTIEL
jgi:hypothetical protein